MKEFGTILELSKIEVFDYNEKTRIHEITVGFVETYATSLDKAFLQGLYERYENTPVAKVFVLSIQEFERFLIEMLPLWKEGERLGMKEYTKQQIIEMLKRNCVYDTDFGENDNQDGITMQILSDQKEDFKMLCDLIGVDEKTWEPLG